MRSGKVFFSLLVVVLLLVGAVWIVSFFRGASSLDKPVAFQGAEGGRIEPLGVVFDPPALDEAPEDIREAVLLGYKIMTETKKYAGKYVGNDLACTNCHFDGGLSKDSIPLVGVAATYPRYRGRRDYSADLTLRTSGCFERSMNGVAPPPHGQIMQSLQAYYHWISKGIPIHADVPWLRLPHDLGIDHKPDMKNGEAVYADVCARCHGDDGQGTDIAPALWGDGSFNDGAGMHRVRTFSSFAYRFMPKNAPELTKEQAVDVAGFAHGKPRPKFKATHPNKIERVLKLGEGMVK
ncbi:c-type cytochrome [Desulfocurvus sp. DL9XJH121]